jgi:hypothetical protein
MNWVLLIGIPVLCAGMGCESALTQTHDWPQDPNSATPRAAPAANPGSGPVALDWAPPALAQLSTQATVKSNFTLDRTMLNVAAGLMSDSEAGTREAIGKLDGVSMRLLRFGDAGLVDRAQVDAVREAYHLRGWKHLVTTTSTGGPVRDGTTDVWLALDGANVRGAVVLVESRRNLALVTVAGNLSPVDLLHLRGHFGIPHFEGKELKDGGDR